MRAFFKISLCLLPFFCHTQNINKDVTTDLIKIDSLARLFKNSYSCEISYKLNKTIINTEGFNDFELNDTIKMKECSKDFLETPFPTVKLFFALLTKHHFIEFSNYMYEPSNYVRYKKGGSKVVKAYLIQPDNIKAPDISADTAFYKTRILARFDRIAIIEKNDP